MLVCFPRVISVCLVKVITSHCKYLFSLKAWVKTKQLLEDGNVFPPLTVPTESCRCLV